MLTLKILKLRGQMDSAGTLPIDRFKSFKLHWQYQILRQRNLACDSIPRFHQSLHHQQKGEAREKPLKSDGNLERLAPALGEEGIRGYVHQLR